MVFSRCLLSLSESYTWQTRDNPLPLHLLFHIYFLLECLKWLHLLPVQHMFFSLLVPSESDLGCKNGGNWHVLDPGPGWREQRNRSSCLQTGMEYRKKHLFNLAKLFLRVCLLIRNRQCILFYKMGISTSSAEDLVQTVKDLFAMIWT